MEPPLYSEAAASSGYSPTQPRYSMPIGGEGEDSSPPLQRYSSAGRVADLQEQVTQLQDAISKIDPAGAGSPSGGFKASLNADRGGGIRADVDDLASNRSTETSPYNAEESNFRYDGVDGERKAFLDGSAILEESAEDGGSSSAASTPQRDVGGAPKMRSWLERAKGAREEAMGYAQGDRATRAPPPRPGRGALHSSSSETDSDDDRIFEPTAVRAGGEGLGRVSSAGGEMRSARSVFLQHLRGGAARDGGESEEYSLDELPRDPNPDDTPPRPPRQPSSFPGDRYPAGEGSYAGVGGGGGGYAGGGSYSGLGAAGSYSSEGAGGSYAAGGGSYASGGAANPPPLAETAAERSERYARMGGSVGRGLSDLRSDGAHRSPSDGEGAPPPYAFSRSHSYTLGSSSNASHAHYKDTKDSYVHTQHTHYKDMAQDSYAGTHKSYAEELARRNSESFGRYMAAPRPSVPLRESTPRYNSERETTTPRYNSDYYSEGASPSSYAPAPTPPAPPRSRSAVGDHPPGSDQARAGVYEYRCRELEKRLQQAEGEAAAYADSLSELHAVFKATAEEALDVRKKEKALQAQVDRLQTENRRHASNRTAVEKLFTQKLELAQSERDMLAMQLAGAYEEIAVRDAALADSAAYMQALRRRNAELQVQVRALLVDRVSGKDDKNKDGGDDDATGVFGLGNIKTKIEEAVKELASVSENERKDRIKALRLRWHPDKNPVLQEFATEVTKIINEAVSKLPT